MSIDQELGFRQPIAGQAHEALLNIVLTGNMLSKEGTRILRPYGMTDSQFNVLMVLKYQSNEGVMNQTELGDMLLVNRSNVTGLIDRIEQAGWVKRLHDAEDRRVNLVKLTENGLSTLEKAEKAYNQRVEEVMSGLNERDNKKLCQQLKIIRRQLR